MISVGFYYKPLITFTSILLVGLFAFTQITKQRGQAFYYDTGASDLTLHLKVNPNGKAIAFQAGHSKREELSIITPHRFSDRLFFKVLDEPGVNFSNVEVFLHLPQALKPHELKTKAWLIHSSITSHQTTFPDPKTILFSATQTGPGAIFSIQVDLPKNVVSLPLSKQLGQIILDSSLDFWFVAGIVIPLIALLILLYMFYRSLRQKLKSRTDQVLKKPPYNWSPAMVGALVTGKVSSRQLASTIVDLATRGWLIITYKDKDFSIIKRTPSDTQRHSRLRPMEQVLISKLFSDKGVKSTMQYIQYRVGHRLFSDKIAYVYWEIYRAIASKGLFVENPSLFHKRWKNWGLVLFYGGFIGVMIGTLIPLTNLMILPWTGSVLAGLAIIKLAPKMPLYTKKGERVAREWLAFANYLKDPGEIDLVGKDKFSKWLGYALAMGVAREWSARFRDSAFAPPDWFGSVNPQPTILDFDQELFPLVNWIGQALATAHNPVVD